MPASEGGLNAGTTNAPGGVTVTAPSGVTVTAPGAGGAGETSVPTKQTPSQTSAEPQTAQRNRGGFSWVQLIFNLLQASDTTGSQTLTQQAGVLTSPSASNNAPI